MSEQLYGLSIIGPDDLFAAPSKQAAEDRAKRLNDLSFEFEQKHELDPIIRAEVVLWPYSAEDHAKALYAWEKLEY